MAEFIRQTERVNLENSFYARTAYAKDASAATERVAAAERCRVVGDCADAWSHRSSPVSDLANDEGLGQHVTQFRRAIEARLPRLSFTAYHDTRVGGRVGQGLLNFFVRGRSGALTLEEAENRLSVEELQARSFMNILKSRASIMGA
jgi:hypothetical protein